MMKLILMFTLFIGPLAYSQDVEQLHKYIALIENGQPDAVQAELPSLVQRYPNHPGVLYIQALLAKEGADAVRLYQSIVDNNPKSEWADDALFKVYQFYHSIGLYRTAELKMNQLKKEYPRSKHVLGKEEVNTRSLAEEKPAVTNPTDQGQRRTVAAQGQFALQVGAYSTLENAGKQKLFFEDLGFPVEVVNKVKDGRSLYTVHVGNHTTYDEAKAKSAEIKKTYNIDSFVVTR
ncbi:MAG: SPOR domain-containing protein [Bacteroidota bacterium]